MLGIEPLELYFPLANEKQVSCSIELTNDTDYYMAFRIATTSLLPFSIQPNKGIAAPRSKCRATITLSAQEMTPLHNQCEEELTVESTRAHASLTAVDVTDDMFNDEGGNSQRKTDEVDKVVDEVNLTVVFDDTPLLHEEHQKDLANLSVEMGSPGISSQVSMLLISKFVAKKYLKQPEVFLDYKSHQTHLEIVGGLQTNSKRNQQYKSMQKE
jgi:hypothetical protein